MESKSRDACTVCFFFFLLLCLCPPLCGFSVYSLLCFAFVVIVVCIGLDQNEHRNQNILVYDYDYGVECKIEMRREKIRTN